MGVNRGDDLIAGNKTKRDWILLRERLVSGDTEAWEEAFSDYFNSRLEFRYFHPIQVLQNELHSTGEGFSICAIQCSLIEFLESTAQGKAYRYLRGNEQLGPFEYGSSKGIFVEFLTTRKPFADYFSEISATDFYISIRCGLLHEARTKNNWRIWATSGRKGPVNVANKIVYRNEFQDALLQYVSAYGEELQGSKALKDAFIRKFDSLCD